MDDLQDTLEARWASIFGALAAGEDVPPTLRLRAEGMEAERHEYLRPGQERPRTWMEPRPVT